MKNEARIPFYLAWKYLRRGNKWTLALTIFMMSVAFVNLIFITSLFGGIISGTNKQIINTMTGNIYVTPKDGSDYIENQKSVVEKIEKNENVVAASSQISVPATLKYGNYKGNWSIFAIDPEMEKQVTNVSEKISSGNYLDENDLDSIIIGRQIAGGDGVEENAFSFKGAKVGDSVTLSLNGVEKNFVIKGIFYTKFLDTDKRAFISKKALSKIMPNFDDKANTIVIKTKNDVNENSIIEQLKSTGIDENIYSWEEVAGLMSSVAKSFKSINVLMTLVGILIAAVTIFIIIYIDIFNKKREIGILRAIGIKPYIIFCSYIIQAAVFSVAGVIFGTIVYFAGLVPYFNAHPLVLPICDATLVLSKTDFIARAETVMWVAVFSAFIPAYAVTKQKILTAIFGK